MSTRMRGSAGVNTYRWGGLPHMREDPPLPGTLPIRWLVYPHARGSANRTLVVASILVYPHARDPPTTSGLKRYSAVYRSRRSTTPQIHAGSGKSPRMRGDPPKSYSLLYFQFWSTPHARGSTRLTMLSSFCTAVYPACAGIHHRKTA